MSGGRATSIRFLLPDWQRVGRGCSGDLVSLTFGPGPSLLFPFRSTLRRRGDCRRCARVSIKNLVIDGNRANLGRIRELDELSPSSSTLMQTSEELEDDGGAGDELDLEMREANARRQHEGEVRRGAAGVGVVAGGGEAAVMEEVDDGAEVSGSTSPLILLGNNEGQVVSKCVVKDPR